MSNQLKELRSLGQSIWLDDIHRGMLNNGDFQAYITDDDISGVTSNPSILRNAIVNHDDYDAEIAQLKKEKTKTRAVYEKLVIADLQQAADMLRPVYDSTDKLDGYVSLEVSPHYAYDTETTIDAARKLWKLLDRPNTLIKVPATREGLPAIRTLISEGINVNVTLIFSLSRYRDVLQAYADGLSDRHKKGLSVDSIASVASFFMSRIDVLIDKSLDAIETNDNKVRDAIKSSRGHTAVASAKLAYQHYRRSLEKAQWKELKKAGARPQRLLWASTSTKDPTFSKVKYVDELIGPDTVNTLPIKTLTAYRNAGKPEARLEINSEDVIATLTQLAEAGINLGALLQQLEDEGVSKFVKPFDELMATLDERLGN